MKKLSKISGEPCENAHMTVKVSTDHMSGEIKSIGYVATGASPSMSSVSGFPSKLVAGRKVSVRVHTRNASEEEICHGGEVVEGMHTRMGVLGYQAMIPSYDVGDGTYLLSINPNKCDRLLSVTLHGEHVQGSPFVLPPVVNADEFYTSLNTPVQTITGIIGSQCIAFHASGDIFVTSSRNNCVYVYDWRGKMKATIGKKGTGDLEFDRPVGIAIAGDTVYVADTWNHRLQSFTTSGQFLSKFGSRGSGTDQFDYPRGICIGCDDRVYVSDNDNQRVQVFHSDWTFCHSIDGSVPGKAGFKFPNGVAIAADGNLFIAGYGSNNVTVFTPEGHFVRSFEVQNPSGLTIDSTGYFLVTSYKGDKQPAVSTYNSHKQPAFSTYNIRNQPELPDAVFIFDPNGRLIHKLLGFKQPLDVKISPTGSVWVSECEGQRLSKY